MPETRKHRERKGQRTGLIMPNKPLHPCNKPGCPDLTSERFCSEHQKQYDSKYDQERGTSSERGYGTTHRRWRTLVLSRDPLCVKCKERGILKASTDADHIDGNPHNTLLNNGQGLCHECHSSKTARENKRWG
jgi:5-methylcytosine-specific restriction protein A